MRSNPVFPTVSILAVLGWVALGVAASLASPPEVESPRRATLFGSKAAETAETPAAPAPELTTASSKDREAPSETPVVKIIKIRFESAEQARAEYDQLFQQNVVAPGAVRNRVRRLVWRAKSHEQPSQAAELDHILVMLQAAIRNGQVQPWMYEAMGLTMELKNLPREEIERALMSAADFTDDPRAKLAMADYLGRMGYQNRAVDLYRQVGDVHVNDTEIFEKVLSISQHINDGEASEWAALGILRQAARRGEVELWKRAHRIAKVRVDELRAAGADEAADRFEQRLQDALRRDLLVVVRWNGDADVDMMIQEPGGTTCSYRNPRTAAGGVMTGDLADTLSATNDGERSELYVCPEAFSGKYRVLLRIVWGRIPSGKVTVDIYGNQGEQGVRHVHKQIALTEKPALVTFDLANGRRAESLEQHQLVNDIKTQIAVNRIVNNRTLLAQQIHTVGVTQPGSTGSIQLDGTNPLFTERKQARRAPRTQVGFRPVVSLLPSGATMSVNAVISANRKFVRITALPFFSDIGDVTEFVVGDPGTGTINDDLVPIEELRLDDEGNIVDGDGCILVDNMNNVINQQPPCNVPPPLPPAPAPPPLPAPAP